MMGVTENLASRAAYEKAQELGLTLTSGKRNPGDLGVPAQYDFHGVGRAYDFAGPVSAMEAFYEWAKSSGMFAEILYGADVDHGNHVHVGWGDTLYKGREGKTYLGNGRYIDRKQTDPVTSSPGDSKPTSSGSKVKGIIPNVTRFTLIIVGAVMVFILLVMAFPAVKIQ